MKLKFKISLKSTRSFIRNRVNKRIHACIRSNEKYNICLIFETRFGDLKRVFLKFVSFAILSIFMARKMNKKQKYTNAFAQSIMGGGEKNIAECLHCSSNGAKKSASFFSRSLIFQFCTVLYAQR